MNTSHHSDTTWICPICGYHNEEYRWSCIECLRIETMEAKAAISQTRGAEPGDVSRALIRRPVSSIQLIQEASG